MLITILGTLRNNPPTDLRSAISTITSNIQGVFVAVAGILFVFMFVIGGIQYISSAGDTNRANSAKKTLTYAVGGLVLFLFASIIPNTIRYLSNRVAATGSPVAGIQVVLDYILAGVGLLAVLFIVIGGYQYITSAGNPSRADSAKKTLTYAIIGILAVLLAGIILNSLAYFIGVFI